MERDDEKQEERQHPSATTTIATTTITDSHRSQERLPLTSSGEQAAGSSRIDNSPQAQTDVSFPHSTSLYPVSELLLKIQKNNE